MKRMSLTQWLKWIVGLDQQPIPVPVRPLQPKQHLSFEPLAERRLPSVAPWFFNMDFGNAATTRETADTGETRAPRGFGFGFGFGFMPPLMFGGLNGGMNSGMMFSFCALPMNFGSETFGGRPWAAPEEELATEATHFDVQLLDEAYTGETAKIAVVALDEFNQPVPGYTGTIHFSSTDPSAVLPDDYTFTAADRGVRVFAITAANVGNLTITVTETTTDETTTDDVTEPADEAVSDPTDIVDDPTDEVLDEPTDDVVAETEEPVEEPTDDLTDDMTDEIVEEVVTDTPDETTTLDVTTDNVEDPTSDEVANEVVDDSTDVTDITDDTTEEPINDTTDEVVDDTTSEHTDDGHEHTTDEVVDDTTDEVLDEPTDEVADDGSDVIGEPTDEVVDDVIDEPTDDVVDDVPTDDVVDVIIDEPTDEVIDDVPTGTITIEVTTAPVATHFEIRALRNVLADEPTRFAVVALDASNRPVTNYNGTIQLSSTDTTATLPADFTFTDADRGMHVFTGEFDTTGIQTLAVSDAADESLSGAVALNVVEGSSSLWDMPSLGFWGGRRLWRGQ